MRIIVERHDLNTHPFYQEWVKGTLPIEKLQSYAADYGHFISTIALGWETLGHCDLADEERYHETLWQDFRNEIGAGDRLMHAETELLCGLAKSEFSKQSSCVGALYAFEAQQPHTSASKLAGLEAHYETSKKGKEYFRVHAHDIAEAQILEQAFNDLGADEYADAKASCELVCRAMWRALDGIYGSVSA